jgi:hypothetical protein
MLEGWMRENGLSFSDSVFGRRPCYRRLAGLKRKGCPYRDPCDPYAGCRAVPYGWGLADHLGCFLQKETGRRWLTVHPYGIGEEGERQKAVLENEFGLHVEIWDEGKSWYYPGRTYFVVIRARGDD